MVPALTKSFGDAVALRPLDLEVAEGGVPGYRALMARGRRPRSGACRG